MSKSYIQAEWENRGFMYKRYEYKYKIQYKDLGILYSWLFSNGAFQKRYIDRYVNSLYFDTPDYDFAASNMSGESRRLKIRARWYSKSNLENSKFIEDSKDYSLEIKRKINNVGDKLIYKRSSHEKNKISSIDDLVNEISHQIREIPQLISSHLKNNVLINYNREYFENIHDKNIRLTIDKDIYFMAIKNMKRPYLLSKEFVLCEIKFDVSKLEEVNSIFSNFPFRRVRYSKYLSAMANLKNVSY